MVIAASLSSAVMGTGGPASTCRTWRDESFAKRLRRETEALVTPRAKIIALSPPRWSCMISTAA